jgi:DNA-binding NarL/FixJ family response regulator
MSYIRGALMPITVLVADDAEIVRRAITSLLALHPAVQLVGEASNFAQTIQMANDLKPQIIVMDIHMSRYDCKPDRGLRSRLNCGSRLLAISVSKDEEAEELATSLGAIKLLDMMSLYDELIPAIIQLASPTVSARAQTAG